MNGRNLSLAVITKALLWIIIHGITPVQAQPFLPKVRQSFVGNGWANNSVNTVIFRKNSLTSLGKWQYIAYYDSAANVVLGKRKIAAAKWELVTTAFKGNASDAHNSISIMVDGAGYVHMAWDHHGHPLRYARSKLPHSLDMQAAQPMTGEWEQKVTYPEFYRMPNGNLIFMYRDGQSGQGNLVMKQYNLQTQQWGTLHSNLIDGEGKRNAYWQSCVDAKGTIHLSWVWRESPDVASNHDLCYARSRDGGISWEQSSGKPYPLPITAATAEYALRIPQKSELINQTSMTTDAKGHPYIANYWRKPGDSIPQYQLVYYDGKTWQHVSTHFLQKPFSLSGAGTKSIPISRPHVLVWQHRKKPLVLMVFRAAERSSHATIAMYNDSTWQLTDMTNIPLGEWEPTYDTNLWQSKQRLHVFAQPVVQVDGEGKANMPATPVAVWQWKPK